MAEREDLQKVRQMRTLCEELIQGNDLLIQLSLQRVWDILSDLLLEMDLESSFPFPLNREPES